jgi:hypothetical protein
MITNRDAQRSFGGPTILGDAALHQPFGLPLAANAASAIDVALNDIQASGISSTRNGF